MSHGVWAKAGSIPSEWVEGIARINLYVYDLSELFLELFLNLCDVSIFDFSSSPTSTLSHSHNSIRLYTSAQAIRSMRRAILTWLALLDLALSLPRLITQISGYSDERVASSLLDTVFFHITSAARTQPQQREDIF